MRYWFPTKNEREIKRLKDLVAGINQLEQAWRSQPDEMIIRQTQEWKQELRSLAAPEERLKRLDLILPAAFALVKTACRRLCGKLFDVMGRGGIWEMVPFDVQLMGAIVLHQGNVAEMATGEGKTLVATLPAYLNSLAQPGVQIVTVNEYLAQRDSQWMRPLYEALGVTVGCVLEAQSPRMRWQQYHCDVVYCTHDSLAFDFLRDHSLATFVEQQVQGEPGFAIIDEVDSILIDAARTPFVVGSSDGKQPPWADLEAQIYSEMLPRIQEMIALQKSLCQRYLAEAEHLLRQCETHAPAQTGPKVRTEAEEIQIGRVLYKIKLGDPLNPQLIRLLLSPDCREMLDNIAAELRMQQNQRELFLLQEELCFIVEERNNNVSLTEKGRQFLAQGAADAFTIPDIATQCQQIDSQSDLAEKEKKALKGQITRNHVLTSFRIHITSQLLRAYCLYQKDVHYMVAAQGVEIVSQNTGRALKNMRWTKGLHEAVELKEGVYRPKAGQTLASITMQNLFRRYAKLAGMTGTAYTAAEEFNEIYGMDVVMIPTDRPVARKIVQDDLFGTKKEKMEAVVKEIGDTHSLGRPILVGTASIAESEELSRMLQMLGLPHEVLNAKHHEKEAGIVALAGQQGAITIATNMAGRGTDIKLGPGVAALGGLHVIGTSRSSSRRVDDQLQGRCARQGDPGSVHFFSSLEDQLLRLTGSDGIAAMLRMMGCNCAQGLRHPSLSRALWHAQRECELRGLRARETTLDYDDVINQQRRLVYAFRNELIRNYPSGLLLNIILGRVEERIEEEFHALHAFEDWQPGALRDWLRRMFLTEYPLRSIKTQILARRERSLQTQVKALQQAVCAIVETAYKKASHEDSGTRHLLESQIIIRTVDELWREHLSKLGALREDSQLLAYASISPLSHFKREALRAFLEMQRNIEEKCCYVAFRAMTPALHAKCSQLLNRNPGSEPSRPHPDGMFHAAAPKDQGHISSLPPSTVKTIAPLTIVH